MADLHTIYQTVKSLSLSFAPIILSYGWQYYQRSKLQAKRIAPSIRPVPPHIRNALAILCLVGLVSIIKSSSYFAPENVFKAAQNSRLQIQTDVLWRRVAALRPDKILTETDEKLKPRMNSIEGRCLYLVFGPDTMANCPFCKVDDHASYLIYTLPQILLPHILNMGLLGLVTSSSFGGKEGSRWRIMIASAASLIAVLEVLAFYKFDWKSNRFIAKQENVVHFFWLARKVRCLALAGLDLSFAALLWSSSTNRWFVVPFTATERAEVIERDLAITSQKLSAVGIIRNAAARKNTLRDLYEEYWKHEVAVMAELKTGEEVSKSVRNALASGRLDVNRVERDATTFSEAVILAS